MKQPAKCYDDSIAFTADDWVRVLLDQSITDDKILTLLTAMHSCPDHKANASDLAKLVGYTHHAPLNSMIGRFSKQVVARHRLQPPLRADGSIRWWHVPFLGYDDNNGRFPWVLRPELSIALDEVLGDKISDHLFPEEVAPTTIPEGALKSILVNKYERNRQARRICVQHHGHRCCICGFDFRAFYGHVGYNKIHVHHLTRIADIGEIYTIDPVRDLRPVCPNCHLIIHSRTQPYTIEEVQDFCRRNNGEKGPGSN